MTLPNRRFVTTNRGSTSQIRSLSSEHGPSIRCFERRSHSYHRLLYRSVVSSSFRHESAGRTVRNVFPNRCPWPNIIRGWFFEQAKTCWNWVWIRPLEDVVECYVARGDPRSTFSAPQSKCFKSNPIADNHRSSSQQTIHHKFQLQINLLVYQLLWFEN